MDPTEDDGSCPECQKKNWTILELYGIVYDFCLTPGCGFREPTELGVLELGLNWTLTTPSHQEPLSR